MANFLTKSYLLTQLKNFKSVILDNAYLGKTAKASSATTADSATKATQDGSGNTITSTYATKTENNAKLNLTGGTIQTEASSLVKGTINLIPSDSSSNMELSVNLNGNNTIIKDKGVTIETGGIYKTVIDSTSIKNTQKSNGAYSTAQTIWEIDKNGYGYFKGGVNFWEGTQAEYNILVAQGIINPKIDYYITDGDGDQADAFYVNFDNTLGSGLKATNVQSAIDEIGSNLIGNSLSCTSVNSAFSYSLIKISNLVILNIYCANDGFAGGNILTVPTTCRPKSAVSQNEWLLISGSTFGTVSFSLNTSGVLSANRAYGRGGMKLCYLV